MRNVMGMAIVLMMTADPSLAVEVDFSDLSLPANSYWNGSDYSGGFTSGGVTFANSFVDWGGGYTSWTGFAYSNVRDTTDPGYGNQYAAITGNGIGSKGIYAVGFVGQNYDEPGYPTVPIVATLATPSVVSNIHVTNTTYDYLAMLTGDSYPAKQFGPSDWFLLTVTGINSVGASTGSVNFYLADNGSIVDTWQSVDLSSLGVVSSLDFNLSSSDTDPVWGMNTPAYFALGDLTVASAPVPEPLTMIAVGMGITGLGGYIRRRRKM